MPTLDWIGKSVVVNHHRDVRYRLLHCDKPASAGDSDAGDFLVQGDNLLGGENRRENRAQLDE
jgi:adenine-specific DNA-methyltransferase